MNQMPNNFIDGFRAFMQDPSGRMGIPAQFARDPNGAIQYLMNSGRISQDQFNQARAAAEQMKNNPALRQLFGK